MDAVASIKSCGSAASVDPEGTMFSRIHGVVSAEVEVIGLNGYLEVVNDYGSTFTIFLPPTVAHAMKAAFDKAMAELSKEDAA